MDAVNGVMTGAMIAKTGVRIAATTAGIGAMIGGTIGGIGTTTAVMRVATGAMIAAIVGEVERRRSQTFSAILSDSHRDYATFSTSAIISSYASGEMPWVKVMLSWV